MKKFIYSYILYNHWANKKLTRWLKTLDDKLLYEKTKSSFATIDLTLQHMKNAQHFWYAVITKNDIQKMDETIKLKSADLVIEELLNGSQKMIDTYTKYSDDELLAKVASPVMVQSRFDFIIHVVNHNSYHRGQVISIARFLGITENIPETEYEAFLWFEQVNADDR